MMVTAEEDLVFKLDIVPGRAPTLAAVAKVLEAYGEVLREAAGLLEPRNETSIELVGVEPGSDVFLIALRGIETFGETLRLGARRYPLVSNTALTLGGLIGSAILSAGITIAITPDPRIPDDQMAIFVETNKLMKESVELQKKNMRLYEALQNDPAFESVKVLGGGDRRVIAHVPRREFAERSGLWREQEQPVKRTIETRRAVWEVVLIKPVLEAKPRRWQFSRDGLKFSALMKDEVVLDAIHEKTLPLQVAEGVNMRIEVEYKEQFDGAAWRPMDHTRRVTRVLRPAPPARPVPLFGPRDP